MTTCALLIGANFSNQPEDLALHKELEAQGCKTDFVIWDTFHSNCFLYDIAIIRSTWDYTQKVDLFLKTLENISLKNIKLINSFEVIKWNYNKIYLKQLKSLGVPIVPTKFFQQLTTKDIFLIFQEWDCEELVVKPCISAGGQNTYLINTQNPSQWKAALEVKNPMVQPFLSSIYTKGELSFIFLKQQFQYCIQKTPNSGKFLCQSEHGGSQKLFTPTSSQIQCAQNCLLASTKALTETPLYSRVDMIYDSHENLLLIELELIEPYLFFSEKADASKIFAQTVLEKI